MVVRTCLVNCMLMAFWSLTTVVSANEQVYHHTFAPLDSAKNIDLIDYQGQVILIVNTASYCGLTRQLDDLEALYQRYKSAGLIVIGVPSNDFRQEASSRDGIIEVCRLNYGVTFPMAFETKVRGSEAHPFYQQAREIFGAGSVPRWNFHKYLIGRDGMLKNSFNSTTSPKAPRLVKSVEALLAVGQ